MKKFAFLTLGLAMAAGCYAQEKEIQLPSPDLSREGTLMQALNERKSTREFTTKTLSMQDLGDLLWAAWGTNREDGRRTAGSAMNKQDCDVYAVMPDGAYLYNAEEHKLVLVAKGDLRNYVAGPQKFAAKAPVCLVIVSDYSRMRDPVDDHAQMMCAVDAGLISQNISLFCASAGLATVPRAIMSNDKLSEALGLSKTQHLILNHPVGYFKK